MREVAIDSARAAKTIQTLDIRPGDELTFNFSSLAVLQNQSVNFVAGETVLLHLIVRAGN